MRKPLKDQLKKWKKEKQPRQQEHLSRRDIEDLMGIRGPRYERGRGGALRQR